MYICNNNSGKLTVLFLVRCTVTILITNVTIYFAVKYHLQGYTPHNLHYLCKGDIIQDETQDRIRFSAWKVMDKKIAFLSIYTSVVHVEHLEGPFVTDIEK